MEYWTSASQTYDAIHASNPAPSALHRSGRWLGRLLSSSCQVPAVHPDKLMVGQCWTAQQIQDGQKAAAALLDDNVPSAEAVQILRDLLPVPEQLPGKVWKIVPYPLQLKLADEPLAFYRHLAFVLAQVERGCTTQSAVLAQMAPWVTVLERSSSTVRFRWSLPYCIQCCEPSLASVPAKLHWFPLPTGQLVPARIHPQTSLPCQELEIHARFRGNALSMTDLHPAFTPKSGLTEPYSYLPLVLGLSAGLGGAALSVLYPQDGASTSLQLGLHLGHWLGGSLLGLAAGLRWGACWRKQAFHWAANRWWSEKGSLASDSSASDVEDSDEDLEVVPWPKKS